MSGKDEKAKPEEAAALKLVAERASPHAVNTDTPEKFLTNLSKELEESDEFDAELAAVLVNHLLKVTPQDYAVASAKSAIVTLASGRAARTREEDANG